MRRERLLEEEKKEVGFAGRIVGFLGLIRSGVATSIEANLAGVGET